MGSTFMQDKHHKLNIKAQFNIFDPLPILYSRTPPKCSTWVSKNCVGENSMSLSVMLIEKPSIKL